MRRTHRTMIVTLMAGLACIMALAGRAAASEPVPAGDTAEPALRHWAFGWDPGLSRTGLTVRYNINRDWDVAVAAGPDDYRRDVVSSATSWNDGEESVSDQAESQREESGWVRLSAGRRFWREGRLSVSGVGSAMYGWSVSESRYRELDTYTNAYDDYVNRRYKYDNETWVVGLSIRPSLQVTERLTVEFEGGLTLSRGTLDHTYERWWDIAPGYNSEEETVETRYFRTFGGFDLNYLKFIFRF